MVSVRSFNSFMKSIEKKRLHTQSAFTLIELMTVVAIIAVLASLLLTALMSAKKQARIAICTSNLHQFGVALGLYLDDSNGKRPTVDDLVNEKYLSSPKTLICPEDKTGNWGQIAGTGGMLFISPATQGAFNYSYLLQPLAWGEAEWKLVTAAGDQAGVAACQLHGLGNQNTPNIHNYSGLLLRAQLDGSVIRRQFFWSPLVTPISSVVPMGYGDDHSYLYPLQIFFDNPTNWLSYH